MLGIILVTIGIINADHEELFHTDGLLFLWFVLIIAIASKIFGGGLSIKFDLRQISH